MNIGFTYRIMFALLLLFFSVSCIKKPESYLDCKNDQDMWGTLSAMSGVRIKDGPEGIYSLSACRKLLKTDPNCRLVFSGLSAKKYLFKNGRKAAFLKIVNALSVGCNCANNCQIKKDINEIDINKDPCFQCNNQCEGAIEAIYYFNQPEEDEAFLNFFESNNELLKEAVHNNHAFFRNRPDADKWKKLIIAKVPASYFPYSTSGMEHINPIDPTSQRSFDWAPLLEKVTE